ncbi:hypothetical protein B0A58_13955 [Flavobacterium branchiophilum NBRC 15030 = ATCC 35035]|uniref:Putative ATPase n=1 Tax=Flavobacterium branchiophilum TaxID=55197 RepID=A0A543G426_9FLAO|nr:AAA family ATPase [Flavobacterium branchiophilum]OXA71036.1 hypothetical protein B0A58_13955 [Flavobacterium branchiophilum NBRC 15030 = ATCC 35035]TQM40842.1 putative ATPase [Flavobacterium branchiophilum]GEM56521.1 hypothetical protein FB1_27420 [Flavobacterium branchiophilum NBRC 15030 = ATCC 35035]
MEKAKLIVKNFGPLKDIEIEVRDMVTFIGAQASGKSTLAKLLSIFEDVDFREEDKASFEEALKKYSIYSYLNEESSISYIKGTIHFQYQSIQFSEVNEEKIRWKSSTIHSIFIPTERAFLHLIAENTLGLINNNVQIPKHLLNSGQDYEKAIQTIKELPLNIIDKNIKYKREGKTSYIYHNETEKIDLLESASGLQSIIPILLLVEYANTLKDNYNFNFVVEEPELNLYPKAQHELISYLIKNCLTERRNLILTTHSPFILASLNNLLLAYDKGQSKPKEVAKIIKKESWLNPKKFIAYQLKNGKAYKIMDDKLGQIKENMIDSISNDFSDEFDKLLEV